MRGASPGPKKRLGWGGGMASPASRGPGGLGRRAAGWAARRGAGGPWGRSHSARGAPPARGLARRGAPGGHPPLGAGEMHCWWALRGPAEGPAQEVGGAGSALARRLLRAALERYGAGGAGARLLRGAHGKPLLEGPGTAGLHVSLSHTPGLVGCVVARCPVGLDCEPRSRAARLGALRVARRRFSPDEVAALERLPPGHARDAAFLQTWTLKEALVKATGRGISATPGSLGGFSVLPGAAVPPPAAAALHAWFPEGPLPLPAAPPGGAVGGEGGVLGIRVAAREPEALEVLPEELPPAPAGGGAPATCRPWLAAFGSEAAVPGEERAGEEEAAWHHVASLCAFLPPGEQPLLRMFDGEALLRDAAARGGGCGVELRASAPAGLLLAACSSV